MSILGNTVDSPVQVVGGAAVCRRLFANMLAVVAAGMLEPMQHSSSTDTPKQMAEDLGWRQCKELAKNVHES